MKIKYYGFAGIAGLGVASSYQKVMYYKDKYLHHNFRCKSFPNFQGAESFAVDHYNELNCGYDKVQFFGNLELDRPCFRKEIMRINTTEEINN